jgi:hypothetical protein
MEHLLWTEINRRYATETIPGLESPGYRQAPLRGEDTFAAPRQRQTPFAATASAAPRRGNVEFIPRPAVQSP